MQLCVLCGLKPANPDKREHIPPQGIFIKPIPQTENLITVPSCSDCNWGTHKEDEDFKAKLSLAVGYETPEQKSFWKGSKKPAFATFQKNQKIKRQVLETINECAISTPAGILIGTAQTFSWKKEDLEKVIIKITRGLFFHVTEKILSPEIKVEIIVHGQSGFPKEYLDAIENHTNVISKCGSQYVCRYGIANDAENASLWLHQFYEGFFITAATRPANRKV